MTIWIARSGSVMRPPFVQAARTTATSCTKAADCPDGSCQAGSEGENYTRDPITGEAPDDHPLHESGKLRRLFSQSAGEQRHRR